jgi:hypothetical protein
MQRAAFPTDGPGQRLRSLRVVTVVRVDVAADHERTDGSPPAVFSAAAALWTLAPMVHVRR